MKDYKKEIMGIVNVTDDSYFAASRAKSEKAIGERVSRLIEEGAGIIDIGGCSTRPGSSSVSMETEWEGVSLALRTVLRSGLRDAAKYSIDTFRSEIVRRSYEEFGEFIVNDISAGEDDPEMLPLVGKLGLGYIAMHKRGTPETMQSFCGYGDVVRDVVSYFEDFGRKAADAGVKDYIIDPGFGFSKTIEQNYRMLAGLGEFSALGKKVLVGISRKSMICKYLNIATEDSLPETSALHLIALSKGADILRVHDVKEAVRIVKLHGILASSGL